LKGGRSVDAFRGSVAIGFRYFILPGKEETVNANWETRRRAITAGTAAAFLIGVAVVGVLLSTCETQAGGFGHWGKNGCGPDGCVERPPIDDTGGTWYWMRSSDQEKRVVMGLYNRWCIRCHGVDGRGVWDMPRIPDFTNIHWQECHSDAQIARIVLEGRGCMPTFRQVMTAEQAWGLAHYLRTFVPGTETPPPDRGSGAANRPNPEKKSP
jgi:hypothetical protein